MNNWPTYQEQLRDPRWQKKRLEILNRAEFKCEDCGDDKITLEVHHVTYEKGRLAWEYPNENFKALCEKHHKERAFVEKKILLALCDLNTDTLWRISGELGALREAGVLAEFVKAMDSLAFVFWRAQCKEEVINGPAGPRPA